MKFTLERSDALTAINRVTGVVSRNSNVPILNNVLIETDGNAIRFRATDLDMEATTTCPAAITEPGRTTVNAAKFREIAQSASPGSQISFEWNQQAHEQQSTGTGEGAKAEPRMVVKSGRSRFVLPVLPADIYPSIPDADWAVTFDVDAATFSDMLTRTVFAAGIEMSKPALIGSYLTVVDGDLLAVGCSGRRFATVRTALPDDAVGMPSVIIPTRAVAQVVRLVGDIGSATLSIAHNKFRVTSNGATITGKVIDYEYLEYQRGLPTDIPHVAKAGREALIGCVRRALIAGESDSVGVGVRLAFSAGLLTVTGRNPDEEARDEIEIEYDGPEIVVGLTAAYILDAAANLVGDVVNIGIGENLPVVVFASPSDESAVNTCAKRIVK